MNEVNESDMTAQELHLVVFKLGDEEFAADINSIREIVKYPSMTPVPNTPHHIVGVVNLRGQITTVISLRKRFGMDDDQLTGDTRILIVDIGSENIGLIIDEISEVLKVDGSNLVENTGLDSGRFLNSVSGMVKMDDRLIIMLDLIKAFQEDEDRN
ncbi:MAG: chemotaxis protein CheW [Candidatus Thermoplasmatota archaeon]|nr:chemotaxis protein CheW [Candidatus Thermoplasmatota archaeon]